MTKIPQPRGKPEQIKLAVLETAEWYKKDRITTVRPLFQLLMQSLSRDPNEFHYATFIGPDSFKATLQDLVQKNGVQYIYIGAHGKDGKIHFTKTNTERNINTATFNPIVNKKTSRGIFFGGCELDLLAYYLSVDSRLSAWVAGYKKQILWMDSSMLDMAFFSAILRVQEFAEGPTTPGKSAKAIRSVLQELHERGYEKIIKKLGFSVYVNEEEITI